MLYITDMKLPFMSVMYIQININQVHMVCINFVKSLVRYFLHDTYKIQPHLYSQLPRQEALETNPKYILLVSKFYCQNFTFFNLSYIPQRLNNVRFFLFFAFVLFSNENRTCTNMQDEDIKSLILNLTLFYSTKFKLSHEQYFLFFMYHLIYNHNFFIICNIF